jgi:hypothetical protein
MGRKKEREMSNAAFDKIAKAKKRLDGWERNLNNPQKFQPIMRCEYDHAWDAYQAAKDAAYKTDPARFLELFPNEQMARENS